MDALLASIKVIVADQEISKQQHISTLLTNNAHKPTNRVIDTALLVRESNEIGEDEYQQPPHIIPKTPREPPPNELHVASNGLEPQEVHTTIQASSVGGGLGNQENQGVKEVLKQLMDEIRGVRQDMGTRSDISAKY